MLTALINAKHIYTGKETLSNKVILLEDGSVLAIVDPQDIPESASLIDLQNLSIAPGLIDLQIYGAGDEVFSAKLEANTLATMEDTLLKQGCTGFYATVATNTNDVVEDALRVAREYRKQAKGNFMGIHLEGPFLNPERRGAHPLSCIKKGLVDELKHWIDIADGEIKMLTLAPEIQSQELLEYLADLNIVTSVGHSNASYEEAMHHFDTIPAATHLFNAMSPMHHRLPGLIPAIFAKKPFTSIVADGIHVSYPMIKMAKEILKEKLFLITDAVTETHSGTYQHVFSGDYFSMPDGTLSGSALTMMKAVSNCVDHADIFLDEALRMASLYPARLIRADESLGYIAKGFKANLIAFDQNLELKKTWLNGLLC